MESKERDEKGRFKKGQKPPVGVQFNEGIAREMQSRGVASRLANKRGAELVQAMLERGVKDPAVIEALKKAGYNVEDVTNEVALHARQIEKAQKTGDTKAYNAVMKVAGYETITINHRGPLVITDKEAEALDKWTGK